jgi:hypothetical protein
VLSLAIVCWAWRISFGFVGSCNVVVGSGTSHQMSVVASLKIVANCSCAAVCQFGPVMCFFQSLLIAWSSFSDIHFASSIGVSLGKLQSAGEKFSCPLV